MNKYIVKYDKKVIKQLSKLDKSVSLLIKKWIEKNLLDTTDPRIHGKQLSGDLKQYWRYRIGDYRLIAMIDDDSFIIVAIEIAHRRDIYR